MKKIIVVLLLVNFAIPSYANNTSSNLFKLKTLKCTLGKGSSASWGKESEPKIEIIKWANSREESIMIFDNIDLKAGTARFIGSSGTVNVNTIPTPSGVTLIEETGFGNLNFTTIFVEKLNNSANEYPFVHSRHIEVMGQAVPSQYYGTCVSMD